MKIYNRNTIQTSLYCKFTKMFRFLRRVFIILILLIIVFFIFRLVKPEATNRFVDRVKTIPTTISSRFHREKKSSIVINGDTTGTKSNFEIDNEWEDDSSTLYIEDTTETNEYIENEWNTGDLSRLEELNKEIDKIMTSGNNQVESEAINSENNIDLGNVVSWLINDNELQITEITWSTSTTWFVVIDVEQPYEPENQNTTNTQSNTQNNTQTTTTNTNTQTNNTQNNSTSTSTKKTNKTTPKRWDCGEWLTVQDCEDFARDFWNFN